MDWENEIENIFNKMKWNDKFMVATFSFVFFTIIATPLFTGNVVFATRLLKYRCSIPGCDSVAPETEYQPQWLYNAVPYHENRPEKCTRYAPIGNSSSCGPTDFFTNVTIQCDRNFVFKDKYVTIAQEFGIYCDENNWKLTLPSAISSIGALFAFPIWGVISDRYGRRACVILIMIFSALSGTLKSFSYSYVMFLVLEFVEQVISGATYSMIIIYGCEQVSAKYRTALVSSANIFFSLGEAVSILLAWSFYSWRHFVRVAFIPAFFTICFHWLAPESVRWLVSKNRLVEAEKNLSMNLMGNSKNDNNPKFILHSMDNPSLENSNDNDNQLNKNEMWKYFSNYDLTIRLLICSSCAFASYAVFYGLSYYMITFHGNYYVNCVLLALVEIPSNFFSARYLDCWNRKVALASLYFLAGTACILYIIFSWSKFSLLFFIVVKLLITITNTLIEIYMTEIFPTTIRGTLVSGCIMLGVIGIQLSVQVPILATYWSSLPPIIFAVLLFSVTVFIPLLPETLNKPLPETVADSLRIGSKD